MCDKTLRTLSPCQPAKQMRMKDQLNHHEPQVQPGRFYGGTLE